MGYYADLIKQKQEKRNSAESHLKGLIGKKFKRDTDLERAVNSSIYTEISDWSHPRMVVFDKYTDEKYILTTEDNNQYGKDQEFWISKVQKVNSKEEKDNGRIEEMYREIQELKKKGLSSLDIDKYYGAINYRKTAEQYLAEYKKTKNTDYKYAAEGQLRKAEQLEREYKKHLHNSDEEKENASVQDRFRYKGCMITILKKGENQYTFSIEQNGREEGTNATYPTQDKAEAEAKREVETNWNEKENESPQSATARRKALQKLEDAQKKANWWGDTTMQKLKHDLTYADEETLLDLVEVLDRYLPKFEAKVKSFGNSNEEKGYYAKLAEEKKNSSYNIVWDGELYSIDTYKKALFVEVTVKRKYEKEKARLDSDYQRFRSSIEKIISEVPNK